MDVPEGYKQTEVGVIPEDWETSTIAQAMSLINGFGFKPKDWKTSGTPIIRIQNLNDPNATFNYFDDLISSRYNVENGDLLFAWSGSKGVSFGARIWNGEKSLLNQHIFESYQMKVN